MSNSLTFTPTVVRSRIFPCPNCKQTINTTMQKCPFCSTTIEARVAKEAADLADQVNRACSEANDLMAHLPTEAPGRGEILLFGLIGNLVVRFAFAFYMTPLYAYRSIRWLRRFRGLPSDDAAFLRSKRNMKVMAWVTGTVVFLLAAAFGTAMLLTFRYGSTY